MKLESQLIQKFYDLSEENMTRTNYKRAIWQFYNSYNISCVLTNFNDRNLNKKNKIIKRIIISPDNIDSTLFKKLQAFMKKDIRIIFNAIKLTEKAKDDKIEMNSHAEKPERIGILAFELME